MKLYIHKDIFYSIEYGDETWSNAFKWLLDKKYKNIDYEIINLHYEQNIKQIMMQ